MPGSATGIKPPGWPARWSCSPSSAGARENYRLPDDLMAELFFAQTTGAFTIWFDTDPTAGHEAGAEWYRWMIAAIDILTIAADPRPIGQPHAEPPFPLSDYALLEPPAAEAG